MIRYLSVCSGIEAASVAWGPLGWEAAAFSEIEPFPCAVLAHHYPAVPNWGDMTKWKEWPDARADVLVGGTPCQSFSVAGLRKGMDDPRGNLALVYLAIADRYRPRWLVWENVPGVLSSGGGRDFGAFLGGLAELGYGWAYRVLDAQYFGVPQRRRRVFVVGCLGDWRGAAAVLLERESLCGHPAPRREAGKVAPTVPSRSTAGGGLGTDFDCDGRVIPDVSKPLGAHALSKGRGTDLDNTTYTPFDTTQVTSKANHSNPKPGDPCHPLASGAHAPAVAFRVHGEHSTAMTGKGTARVADPVDIARSLDSCGGYATNQGGNIVGHPAVAFEPRCARNGRGMPEDVCQPLKAQSGRTGRGDSAPCVAFKPGQFEAAGATFPTEEFAPTLQSANNGSTAVPAVASAMQVRRLTPRECERLQGFPDDYTLIPYRGKPAADGPRYKALGNSMAVPVMHWIGERIAAVEQNS